MFFKYNLITTSHIETLLEKENVTLRELMDQEDILQECKAQSKRLIDFLVHPESLNEMITLITIEPDELLDEKTRYKYSNISCELLTSDVASINETLSGNEALLNKLYSFLDNEKPLNPLLASFFSKTLSKIFSRKTEVIFDYLKSKPDFITRLLNHIETSAIMDLLIRLLTYSETIEMRVKVVEWLNSQAIVQRLIGLIDPAFSEECHCNASQALCDMIKASRERMSLLQEKAEEDPLLEAIESTDNVTDLINHMFSGEKKESVFVNGIAILLTLLEFKKHGPANSQIPPTQNQSSVQAENAPQSFTSIFFRNDGPEQMTALDAERLAKGVNNVLQAVMPQIINFHKLFAAPPIRPQMTLTIGCLDPPLGYTRLELSRFIVALIATNTHDVNVQLASLKIVHTIMELFFRYSWNNFLHTQVERACYRIIHNAPTVDHVGNKVHPLMDELMVEYRMPEKIAEAHRDYFKEVGERKSLENGYMGHLAKIANHIAQNSENGLNFLLIRQKLNELPSESRHKWDDFTDKTLVDINRCNSTPLVGGVTLPSNTEDEGVSFRGIPFTQEAALQQAFSNYQGQQISTNFVDQYCFNEDFNEADDNVAGQLNCLAQVRFHRNMLENCSMFEQICRERSFSLTDPDSDEEIWDDKEKSPCFQRRKESEGNSSDSDDDVPTSAEAASASDNKEVKMEIDNQDTSWTANFDGVPMEVGPSNAQNPWETSEQPSSTSDVRENWADFSNFPNFAAAGESSDEISSTTTTTAAVAMETVDPPTTNGKFVSSSEVSSSSDSASQLASHVPVENELPVVIEETACTESIALPPVPLPASGDSADLPKESEAKALVVQGSDATNVTNSIASPAPCEEECMSSTVQNGVV